MQIPGQQKFNTFRDEFPFFTYEGFDWNITSESLQVSYHFNLSDKYFFHPGFKIPFKSVLKKRVDEQFISLPGVQNLLFHIGMIELISYWKATCSPVVIIRGYKLDEAQVEWWKNVYFQGLGEFFYI